MKENLGNRIGYGNASLQAENLGTRSAKRCWDTAHFQSTRAGFLLESLVGLRNCAGATSPGWAGQRRPQELAEGINLATGFQKLKSFEVDLHMPSLCKCTTSSLHCYLLLQHLLEQ